MTNPIKWLAQRRLERREREEVKERLWQQWREQQERSEVRVRFDLLTLRERQVLVRVVDGMLNKQIAAELGISEVTVKGHRSHLMQKLRAKSVAELVRLATRLGMTDNGCTSLGG